MNFSGLLRTFGPRLLGSVLAGVSTWIGVKTSGAVNIDPEWAAGTVTSIFLSYSAGHRGTSAKVNKGDAATSRVAEGENRASERGTTVVIPPPTLR